MRVLSVVVVILSALPALADDVCAELWFTRNLIFDRAGYCFGSNLGQALFDNSDCTTRSPDLNASDADKVARLRANETMLQCATDTSETRLDLEGVVDLRRLQDLPVRAGTQIGCVGWRGGRVPLLAGNSDDAPEIGQIVRGDAIGFLHESEDEWDFLTVFWGPGDGQFGWTREDTRKPENCAQITG
ncbi:DUF4453 domain-containing protein [Yoonia sediminilitoris]|nr:DUF4453 domain-containing protein [Yoonia sediminilitoris]